MNDKVVEKTYSSIRYFPPKFFINVGEDGTPGNSILMFTSYCTTKEEAHDDLNNEIYLLLSLGSEIILNIYKDEMLNETISERELIKGKHYIAAKPLMDGIWELPKEKQAEIVNYAKSTMICALLGETLNPSTDLLQLEIILENYSKPTRNGDYNFVPISSPIYIQNTHHIMFKKSLEEDK